MKELEIGKILVLKLETMKQIKSILVLKFFKIKINKLYLKSTMFKEKLSGLVILSIEKKMLEELDYKNLISQFVSQKAR